MILSPSSKYIPQPIVAYFGCSAMKQILAICSTALIFLLLFPSREKEVKLIEHNGNEVVLAICSKAWKS